MKPPARFFRVLFDGLKVATADLERHDPKLIPGCFDECFGLKDGFI